MFHSGQFLFIIRHHWSIKPENLYIIYAITYSRRYLIELDDHIVNFLSLRFQKGPRTKHNPIIYGFGRREKTKKNYLSMNNTHRESTTRILMYVNEVTIYEAVSGWLGWKREMSRYKTITWYNGLSRTPPCTAEIKAFFQECSMKNR